MIWLIIRSLIFLITFLCINKNVYAQAKYKLRGVETQRTISKRHRAACYINEVKDKRVYDKCQKLFEEATEEIEVDTKTELWRSKINDYYKKGFKEKKDEKTGEVLKKNLAPKKNIELPKLLCG